MKYYRKGTKARKASQRRRAAARAGVLSISSSVRAKEDRRPPLTSPFAKAVLSIVNRKEETKYVAKDFGPQTAIDNISVPASLQFVLPMLTQGVGSHQRIGQKVNNVHGRVDFQFFFVPPAVGVYPTQDVWVKIFKLNSKLVKSYPQIGGLQQNTLLDVGNQTTVDFNNGLYSAPVCSQMPLSREDFSGLVHTMRLTKNQGTPNSDTASGQSPNTFGHTANCYSYTWKHKGNLLYDDTGNTYPTNYAPLFAVVVMTTDNTPIILSGQVSPVQYITRSHMWYKDV